MTGPYEQGLVNIAEGGAPFDIPIVSDLVAKLVDLRDVVDAAAQQPGIDGESADTASERFQVARETISAQISYLENALQSALRSANGIRDDARERLANLPSGQLSSGQEAVVRTAAAGTTLIFGPLALLAGEGVVQAFNGQLSQQREAQAKRDFETVSSSLQGLNPPSPPSATFAEEDNAGKFAKTEESTAVPSGGSPSGSRPSSGGGSTNDSPAFVPRGYDPAQPVPSTPTPEHLIPRPDTPRGPGLDLSLVPPHYTPPTPDGSISGIGTLPGHISGPGSIGGSFPGGISGGGAGLGSGLSAGLIAGGGGAAALSRLSSGTGSSTAAAGRTISGSGGLLGKSGASATGAGLGGRSGTGSLGGGATGGTGTPGTGANAAAAGGRGAAAPTGAGGTGGGTAGAAGSRGAGGMGSGSRSDRRDERRGLGGPIAPRLEDDEETAPRSENAAAGSRDD
ncbi:hypothetical protein [Microbacterium testaceum]|uniref:hypothetical protein n=1 Tax=Microbacterium testaceum TaxID=2033 RepID=UPI000CCDB4DB|nr:hypothetical protein [Microbacterium testaceum]MDZ5143772.1 hypothetical protein [Microbacterium testaceum]PNW09285.1 hypothetical protein C1632_09475 [Microbacterium testaceum]